MRVLVVVDMQHDFIDGSLGTHAAQFIVPKVKEKIQRYLRSGDKIVYTRDTHHDDYMQTQEGRNLPVPHCIQGTEGWQIHPDVALPDAPVFDKNTFGSLSLSRYLSDQPQPELIELIGLCTDICVISNALLLKAAMPEVPIQVDASCCAGTTDENHRTALHAMRMCQIIIHE